MLDSLTFAAWCMAPSARPAQVGQACPSMPRLVGTEGVQTRMVWLDTGQAERML